MRLGLCCLFKNEPVKFRTTTAKALAPLDRTAQLLKLSGICLHNAANLLLALETAQRLGFGSFRIMSPLFPRMTHPGVGYGLADLPDSQQVTALLAQVNSYSADHDIRLSFHPDQFVVLSSPHAGVVDNSLQELEYQGMLAEAVGADVINIHGGGVYGDKQAALRRLCEHFAGLSAAVRQRLTLENDDNSYTVRDLLPVCEKLAVPLVYDAHHHRCNPDGLTIEEATHLAGETWQAVGREQYCHISSPKNGWGGSDPKPHADYIEMHDFPDCWRDRAMTIDVEAKAKELAVVQLRKDLNNK
jgi:UV DNA damage endonuclease